MKRMAMGGRLRKLHRRNRPGLSRRVVPDHTRQHVNRRVNPTTDPRLRCSSKHIILGWIIMGWSIQRPRPKDGRPYPLAPALPSTPFWIGGKAMNPSRRVRV